MNKKNNNNKTYKRDLKKINQLLNEGKITSEKTEDNTTYIKYNNEIIYTINKDGCLPIYTYEYKKELLQKLIEYIETEDYPTVPDFCRKNRIHKQRLYEFASDKSLNRDDIGKPSIAEGFADCIKKMNNNQEAFIEENALNDKIPSTFAIFKLKQLGWSDKQQIEADLDLKLDITFR